MRAIPAVLLGMAVFFLTLFTVFADEPKRDATESKPTNQQLLERIEALETRVAALEERRGPRASERPQVAPPELRVPVPRRDPSRRLPPDANVPDDWQRFEFNGQYFYIIPADEAAPDPTQRRRETTPNATKP